MNNENDMQVTIHKAPLEMPSNRLAGSRNQYKSQSSTLLSVGGRYGTLKISSDCCAPQAPESPESPEPPESLESPLEALKSYLDCRHRH